MNSGDRLQITGAVATGIAPMIFSESSTPTRLSSMEAAMGFEQFAAITWLIIVGTVAAGTAVFEHRPSVWFAAGACYLLALVGWLNRPKGRYDDDNR